MASIVNMITLALCAMRQPEETPHRGKGDAACHFWFSKPIGRAPASVGYLLGLVTLPSNREPHECRNRIVLLLGLAFLAIVQVSFPIDSDGVETAVSEWLQTAMNSRSGKQRVIWLTAPDSQYPAQLECS